jgi:cytochrome P450
MAKTSDRPGGRTGVVTSAATANDVLPYVQRLMAARRFDADLELLRDVYGTVSRRALGPTWLRSDLVVVSSPGGARDILARDDEHVERGMTRMSWELRKLIGDGLLVVPHREWLPRRRALQSVFAGQNIPRFAGHMAEAADQLARTWGDEADVDLDAECRSLILRALCRSMLGLEDDMRMEELGSALRTAVKWAADRALRPGHSPQWLPTRRQRQAHAASAALHELAADMLQACRSDPARPAPLVRALMQTADPQTGQPLTDRAICDELLSFMIAGHQTTSIALTYALWALGHAGDCQERVAAEVSQLGDRQLTQADISQLGYTVQVLHEALRLCPPIRAVERFVTKDINVDGHRVEAGTHVVVAIKAIHRDPGLWEDPLTFDPDRFSPERSQGRNPWQYLPFGAGPRACIADHFAMVRATLAIAAIIRRAEIRSLEGYFPVNVGLTAMVTAPIPAQARQRKLESSGWPAGLAE